MDLILGCIFEFLGECVIEYVLELVTRVLLWLGYC
jgi:hypothetical protein